MLVFCSASRKLTLPAHSGPSRCSKISSTICGARPIDGSSSRIIFGPRHQRAADRASSAARRRRCIRPASCAAPSGAGNIRRHARGRARDSGRAVAAGVGAGEQVLLDREVARSNGGPPSPGSRRACTSSEGVRRSMRSPSNSIVALGHFAALGLQQVGDRLQRGGLAGAVGAQQRDDAALGHRQRNPFSTRITWL